MQSLKNKIFSKKALFAGAGAFLALALIIGASTYPPKPAHAATYTTIHMIQGFAWSSTIGWISLNCPGAVMATGSPFYSCPTTGPDYGLEINSSGALYGYAWSSNIGWISFRPTDTAVCGSAATVALTSGTSFTPINTVSGWARALAGGTATSPTWDGCISLRGTSPSYGVTFTNPASSSSLPTLSGFAWGSTNVGWLKFYGAMVDLKVNGQDTTVAAPYAMSSAGGPITLSWTTQNVSSCTAMEAVSGGAGSTAPTGWQGTSPSALGATMPITIPPNTGTTIRTRTYTISCTPSDGSSGTVNDFVTVTLAASNAPLVQLYANGSLGPISVDSGTPVTLSWTTQNVANTPTCMADSPTGYTAPSGSASWNGTKASSGTGTPVTYTYVTGPITSMQKFRLYNCKSAIDGSTLPEKIVEVDVNAPSCEVTPASAYIVPSGTTISGTQNFSVTWHHTGFHNSTLSLGTPPTGVTVTPTSSLSLTSTHTSATVSATGTYAPPATLTMSVSATSSGISPAITCTPATLNFGTPPAGPVRPPLQEI